MKICGKKVLFLGDSITEGYGTSCEEKSYTNVFARISGAVIYNYGIGGTRIARQHKPTLDKPHHDLNFVDRSLAMNDEADLIVVFGGTNDFKHGDAPIGCFEDRCDTTFYGAMHTLICNLYNKYPTTRVVFMTPLHRTFEHHNEKMYNNRYVTLKDYVNVIREVCEYYAVPVLDLYSVSGLQPAVEINPPAIPATEAPDNPFSSNVAIYVASPLQSTTSVFQPENEYL